jgi:hypothetical protein
MARKKKNGLDLKSYQLKAEQSLTRRAAHFLDWLARKHPGQFVQYNVMYKSIMGFARTPRLDSEEVERMRKSLSRTKLILDRDYKRGMVRMPSVGVRATHSDEDRAVNELPAQVKRMHGAKQRVQRTVDAIDPRKITDAKIRSWFKRDIGGVLRAMNQADFDVKALPPAQKDE